MDVITYTNYNKQWMPHIIIVIIIIIIQRLQLSIIDINDLAVDAKIQFFNDDFSSLESLERSLNWFGVFRNPLAWHEFFFLLHKFSRVVSSKRVAWTKNRKSRFLTWHITHGNKSAHEDGHGWNRAWRKKKSRRAWFASIYEANANSERGVKGNNDRRSRGICPLEYPHA